MVKFRLHGKTIKCIPLFLIMAFFVMAESFAYEDGDFQYWNTNAVEWKAAQNWTTSLEEELRFGDSASELYYQHTDLALTYSGMAEWLDITASYRQVFNKKSNHWEYENRPNLNGTLKFDLFALKISDRNRIEYRDIENKKDNWRYRNRAAVKVPFKIHESEIAPYIADEIFYNCNNSEINKNRLSVGIELALLKNLKIDIFYMLETARDEIIKSRWTDCNILGTKLKLVF